jgi:hypothetical protein
MEDATVPTAGQIRERTRVPGMRALGAAWAERAARPAPRRDDLQMNGRPVAPQALDPHPCAMRKNRLLSIAVAAFLQRYSAPGASAYRQYLSSRVPEIQIALKMICYLI